MKLIIIQKLTNQDSRVELRDLSNAIREGIIIDYRDNYGNTLLMHTISNQQDNLAVYLLNQGANPLIKNDSGEVARDWAANNASLLDLIKEKERIIELKSASSQTKYSELLLDYVQKNGIRAKKIDELLSLGADINYQDSAGFSPLMYAVDYQNDRIAEYLLCCGANPILKSESGSTAKFLASRSSGIYQIIQGYEFIAYTAMGNLSGMKSLLKTDRSIIDFQGRDGCTPLLLATQLGLTEIVEYLLSQQADLEITLTNGNGIFDLIPNKTIERLVNQAKEALEPERLDVYEEPSLVLDEISTETSSNDVSIASEDDSVKNNFFKPPTNIVNRKHANRAGACQKVRKM